MFLAFRKLMGTGAVLLCVLAALASFQPAEAAAGERCFTETGYCISGPIRAYWERNGGLAVFGYPITAQRIEIVEQSWEGPVQWFERDRLEDHSADKQGVLAGRIGARYLEVQGRAWQFGTEPVREEKGCVYFTQTGYNSCDIFLDYWKRYGGEARVGYPITGVIQETIGGRTYSVQYFERRRLELHPENAG